MSDTSLSEFIEATGSGLSSAQADLAGSELTTTAMAVAEAELEARVALSVGTDGAVRVVPVSLDQAATVNASTLSTVKVNYVALSGDAEVAQTRPSSTGDKVIESVAERPDVKRLDAILGGLTFSADFVPDRQSWLVRAVDGDGLVVRDLIVEDR